MLIAGRIVNDSLRWIDSWATSRSITIFTRQFCSRFSRPGGTADLQSRQRPPASPSEVFTQWATASA